MNNKLLIGVLVIVLAAAGFLFVQNRALHKQVNELSGDKDATVTSPVIPQTTPANPKGASPFDKPNVDPMADRYAQPDTPVVLPMTSMKFDRMVHNFGRIQQGEVVTTEFTFTNTGNKPLVIVNAQGSCGCTVPRWPRDPVKPGASAIMHVQFDSHDKQGETEKTVTVDANTNPKSVVLTIKATVIPKDK